MQRDYGVVGRFGTFRDSLTAIPECVFDYGVLTVAIFE